MKRYVTIRFLMFTVALVTWTCTCLAQESEGVFGDTTFNIGSWELEWIPDKTPYPAYVADPRRPRMQVGVGYIDTEIPDTSRGLVNLDAGTRVTLLRMQRGAEGANEFALDVEGGLFTRFDLVNGLDNIGWDGRYGIYLAWDWSDTIAARFGYRHISAHLGDEYIEETGRSRINYTRDDWRIGLGFHLADSFLLYVEPSYAWHMGNLSLQEEWAVEGGVQYQGPYTVWKNSLAWYGGVHVASWQENGWNPSIACQVGVKLKRDPKRTRMRFGIEGYKGRAVLGEFALDYSETYVTAGFFFDFF